MNGHGPPPPSYAADTTSDPSTTVHLPDRTLLDPDPEPARLDILFQLRKNVATSEIRAVELSIDGSTILTVSRVAGQPVVETWNFVGLRSTARWNGTDGAVSPDGKNAIIVRTPASQSERKGGAWHEQLNGPRVGACPVSWVGGRKATFEPVEARRSPLAFSRDGNLFVAGTDLDRVCVYNIALKGRCCTVLNHVDEITHAAFTPDGDTVVTASRDSTLRVSCSRTGMPVAKLEVETWHAPRLLRVSLDGKLIVSVWGSHVHLWRPDSGDLAWYNLNVTRKTTEGWPLAISPDCRFLACRTEDGMDITDIQSGTVIGLMSHMGSPITAATFSLGGEVLIVGKISGSIEIWHLSAVPI